MTCYILMTCSPTVHDLFMKYWWLIDDLFMTCYLLMTCSNYMIYLTKSNIYWITWTTITTFNYFIQIISWKRMKELYSSYEQVMKKSWTSHQQILNKLWTSHDLFMTCSLFVHELFVTCSCSQLLHYLFILVHLSTTSSWLVHNLFINYSRIVEDLFTQLMNLWKVTNLIG